MFNVKILRIIVLMSVTMLSWAFVPFTDGEVLTSRKKTAFVSQQHYRPLHRVLLHMSVQLYTGANKQASFTDEVYGFMLATILAASTGNLNKMTKQPCEHMKTLVEPKERRRFLLSISAVIEVLDNALRDFIEPSQCTILSENEELKHLESPKYYSERLFWLAKYYYLDEEPLFPFSIWQEVGMEGFDDAFLQDAQLSGMGSVEHAILYSTWTWLNQVFNV